ncbi:SDR family NAD(P)-dependent oxidoreductase [Parendozoicomonas sp. Alg238-R29]|uniref:SDR family NAD(P)-dependent oxidoreductase n=1 Tax=Parendozoicomonas sp. Alg238-R29 TaxID=2993446 RepID=UPI00248E2F8B|nr:SDR family NAD(P)-dependent oxidoreductase [Parendozoicomonas sp. Alg238-R29]
MQKIILLTGATDGIGLETAKALVSQGHYVLLHGRNASKLQDVENALSSLSETGMVESYVADLSRLADVKVLAQAVIAKHKKLDVVINNAGVYKTPSPVTQDGLDVRFAVNTIAPYLLTQQLLSILGITGRVVNISSAAQAPVNLNALVGKDLLSLSDSDAYAQSKLAITMWSRHMAQSLKDTGSLIVAINPASFLGSKMVKDAYGMAGKDLSIGVDILCRAALSDEFSEANGLYFDNDIGRFSDPHADALSVEKCQKVVERIEAVLARD